MTPCHDENDTLSWWTMTHSVHDCLTLGVDTAYGIGYIGSRDQVATVPYFGHLASCSAAGDRVSSGGVIASHEAHSGRDSGLVIRIPRVR